ncbi:MinD-like ATPase involved in chromosome partitioning or flagellar assembly [Oerskovia enterophila]
MTTTTVPTWPHIEAVIREDGTGEVTINGTSHALEANSLEEARNSVIETVAATAKKVGRPVRVATTSPDGDWPLIVHPDGTVAAAEADTATPPRGTRAVKALATAAREAAVPADAGPDVALEPGPVSSPLENNAPEGAESWVRENQSQPTTRREVRQSFLVREQVEEPASKGIRGALAKVGIRLNPSEEERRERDDEHAVSQHWPGPRTIAVVNGKGGAGKTPTTVLLSAIFARYGGAGVLAWDNNQTRGTLGWRTEQGPHEATLLDMLPQTDRLLSTSAQSADLAHYVHHQTRDRFDVLRSQPVMLADQQRLGVKDVDAIHSVASKYYRLVFIDSGNDESDPLWLRMIDHADQLVVATTTRADIAEAGALLLEALGERDERSARLAARAVAVVSQAEEKASRAEVDRVANGYQAIARDVVTIPFDPAMVDGTLRYGSLRPATRRAWLAAGAAVARGL